MNDQNERDERHVFHWSGRDRDKDTAALADTLATVLPLYQADGGLFQLEGGKLVGVSFAEFCGLVDKAICGVRAVNGSGVWKQERFTYGFPARPRFNPTYANPSPPPELEPDDKVIEEIFRRELGWRLPRVQKG
jgi:hypothetical protein